MYTQKQRKISFTEEGYQKLKKEQKSLIEKRKDVIKTLRKAREMGDLSENGLYKAAKFELGNTDRRLRYIDKLLHQATIVSYKKSDSVVIGSTVSIEENGMQHTYKIVGDFEADPLQNKISQRSPIGKALFGKKVGESITLSVPAGEVKYKIVDVS